MQILKKEYIIHINDAEFSHLQVHAHKSQHINSTLLRNENHLSAYT
jgi:hypothetical protein